MATLRTRVAERYRALSLQYHRETPTGELLAHMEADVKAAVDVFWPVPFAVGVIMLTVLALVALLLTDPWLALVGLIAFPSLAVMNRIFARRMEEPAQTAQERIGDVSAVAHESIDGALVVKTLGREDAETRRLTNRPTPSARPGFEAARSGPPSRPRSTRCRRWPSSCCSRSARHAWPAADHAGRADRFHRAVPAVVLAHAVHRVDPGRAAAGRRGIRPHRGGPARTRDGHACARGDRPAGRPPRSARPRPPLGVRPRHARAGRRELRGAGRGVGGDRRPHGRRQEHPHPADGSAGRPRHRPRGDRWRRPARGGRGVAPCVGRRGVPGELPVRRQRSIQHRPRLRRR